MTIYYPDAASYQAGLSLKGALAVCAKATEGTAYVNPYYGQFAAEAAGEGAFFFAYHFLHHGEAAAQAHHAYSVAGKTPLMLDTEPAGTSRPSLADVTGFMDAYRALGGVAHLLYLPRWYWAQQPFAGCSLAPAASRNLVLVSSAYTTYTDAASGTGWQPYGGMAPAIWQYTSSLLFNGQRVDFNAFRGSYAGKQDPASVAACLAEMKSLVTTGKPRAAHQPGTPLAAPAKLTGDDDMTFLFGGRNAVTPLIVPAGASRVVFAANEVRQKQPPAKLRLIFNPHWADARVSVSYRDAVSVDIPKGETSVTVLREDAGAVHVAVAFAS